MIGKIEIPLISQTYETKLIQALKNLNLELRDSKKIADCILTLSDFYISSPDAPTPWEKTWAQVAYLAYYHPLNVARNSLVITRGLEVNFFQGLKNVIDFGAGLGAASEALQRVEGLNQFQLIESSSFSRKLIENTLSWNDRFEPGMTQNPKELLCVFSYALTELDQIPAWAMNAEALMILEPATHQDGRSLLTLREKLITEKKSIWAPCLHQLNCPLLKNSKTDWCHDRGHLLAPDWFKKIESHLPFRNETITTSYLLVRNTQAPSYINTARTVGDHLLEKGKSRQMICRNSKREFLSWLLRDFDPPVYSRGSIIQMPEVKELGAELRVVKTSRVT